MTVIGVWVCVVQELLEVRGKLEVEEKQKSSLSEEIDGLSWKLQETEELQHELDDVRAQLYQVSAIGS